MARKSYSDAANEKAYERARKYLDSYRGRYVAFVGQTFVDADMDKEKLKKRVFDVYRKMPYLRKVE